MTSSVCQETITSQNRHVGLCAEYIWCSKEKVYNILREEKLYGDVRGLKNSTEQ